MTARGRRAAGRPALAGALAIVIAAAAPAAAACTPGLAVVRLADGAVLHQARADRFELRWRHSVTLDPVLARYVLDSTGIRQTEERFASHGPGLAHDAEGWRREGDSFVLPLDRPIDRLILRSAPRYENRLLLAGQDIDLTRWPGQPLELTPLPCKEPAP